MGKEIDTANWFDVLVPSFGVEVDFGGDKGGGRSIDSLP
jgi:hypothetical protein